jgi:hypothetical protein
MVGCPRKSDSEIFWFGVEESVNSGACVPTGGGIAGCSKVVFVTGQSSRRTDHPCRRAGKQGVLGLAVELHWRD